MGTKKLTSSKETLRVLDDEDLTYVVGGCGRDRDRCRGRDRERDRCRDRDRDRDCHRRRYHC